MSPGRTLKILAIPAGLEPATRGVETRYSLCAKLVVGFKGTMNKRFGVLIFGSWQGGLAHPDSFR
jgi:hypothetical protein